MAWFELRATIGSLHSFVFLLPPQKSPLIRFTIRRPEPLAASVFLHKARKISNPALIRDTKIPTYLMHNPKIRASCSIGFSSWSPEDANSALLRDDLCSSVASSPFHLTSSVAIHVRFPSCNHVLIFLPYSPYRLRFFLCFNPDFML